MKHPFYSVSIDEIPFGDRIIAILLCAYLVRCEDAEQKLAAVLSEGIVLKLPDPANSQDAIPLKTVLEGEHVSKLIDEAVTFMKEDQTDHSDSDMGDIFGDIFGDMFGGGNKKTQTSGPVKGADIKTTIRCTFEEAAFGTQTEVELPLKDECPVCQGSGAQPGHPAETCGKCGGKGQVALTQQSLFGMTRTIQTCPDCQGSGKIIKFKCSNCAGSGFVKSKKIIQIKVPAGIDNGQSIRLREMGEPGINGGARGDLIVTILVDKHAIFQRQEYDLYSTEQVAFTQAALGGKITINTIDGPYEYDLAPGTQTNTKITLKGKGIPTLRNKNVRGNHYVTLMVEVPENLTEEQKQVLKQQADPYAVEVRAATDSLGGFSFVGHKKKKKGIKKV